MNHSIDES
jgi:hypothetical protein